jgi:glucose-1-phosphatase
MDFNSHNIENLVFDFGGVLLDIDYQRTYDALSHILNLTFDPAKLPEDVKQVLEDFEKGEATRETFIWNLQRQARGSVPQGWDVINAWNAMLMGWNPLKFDFLLQLRTKYKVYLLSNTNELHMEWVRKDLKRNHQIEQFDDVYFDQTFYSHIEGFKKPDIEFYHHVAHKANLDPAKTIFIDDLLPNILGAQEAGWHTYYHNPNDDLIEIFKNKLNL